MSSNIFGAFSNNAADSITKTKSNVDRMYPSAGAAEYQYYYPQNPYYQDSAMAMDHPMYNNMYQHGYGVRAETTGYAAGNAGGGGGYDAPTYQNNGGYSTVQNYGPPQQNYNYGGGGGHSHYGNSGVFSNYGGGGGGGGGASYAQSYTHSSTPRHKSKGTQSAMSALTLLAFLFFLNILQSCLKEHMNTMNPTVMVMTAGAGRQSTAQKKSNEYPLMESKIDSDYQMYTSDEFHDDKRKMESNDDNNYEQIRTVKSNPYRNNTFISTKLRNIDKN